MGYRPSWLRRKLEELALWLVLAFFAFCVLYSFWYTFDTFANCDGVVLKNWANVPVCVEGIVR